MNGLRIAPSRWNAIPLWPKSRDRAARDEMIHRKIPDDCSSFWFFFALPILIERMGA